MTYKIKVPEILLDTAPILKYLLDTKPQQWNFVATERDHSLFSSFSGCDEIDRLRDMIGDQVPLLANSPIRAMKFDPQCVLPIHTDGIRTAVIQIPLSVNCASTPTKFYDNFNNLIDEINWKDGSAWMFDTKVKHSVWNDSHEVRYTLLIPFFLPTTYAEIESLYLSGKFFKT